MKVLFIYDFCNIGGLQTLIKNRMSGLKVNGVESTCLFLNDGMGRNIFKGMNIEITNDVKSIKSLLSKHDAVINCSYLSETARLIENLSGSKIFYDNQIPNYFEYLRSINPDKYHCFLVPTNYQGNNFKQYIKPSIPVEVCYDCIHPMSASGMSPSLPEGLRPICHIGRMQKEKGWRLYLDIMYELMMEHEDIYPLIITQKEVSPEYNEFEAYLKRMGLSNVVIINNLPYEEMPSLYTEISNHGGLVISTSDVKGESFGMVLAESMLYKCPVLAADNELNREVLPFKCQLYNPLDINDIKNKVLSLLYDEGFRKYALENQYNNYKMRFTAEGTCKTLLGIIQKYLG